ncbi:hypothetical protein ACQKNS_18045 [Peribacillus sp. NPDC094092]
MCFGILKRGPVNGNLSKEGMRGASVTKKKPFPIVYGKMLI